MMGRGEAIPAATHEAAAAAAAHAAVMQPLLQPGERAVTAWERGIGKCLQ